MHSRRRRTSTRNCLVAAPLLKHTVWYMLYFRLFLWSGSLDHFQQSPLVTDHAHFFSSIGIVSLVIVCMVDLYCPPIVQAKIVRQTTWLQRT